MTKFSKFSIWDDEILKIVDKCLADNSFKALNPELKREDLIEFFYDEGGAAFYGSEVYSIYDDSLLSLKQDKQLPRFYPTQILGNKVLAFESLKNRLIMEFPESKDLIILTFSETFTTAFFYSFVAFFKIEAIARSNRSKSFNNSENKNPDQLDGLLIEEFTKILENTTNSILKRQIEYHIIFLKEGFKTASPTTRQRSIPRLEESKQVEADATTGLKTSSFSFSRLFGFKKKEQPVEAREIPNLPLAPNLYSNSNK